MKEIAVLNELWLLLTTLAYLVMGWGMWQLSKRFVSRKEHEEMRGEVGDLRENLENQGKALSAVEGRLAGLPPAGEVNKILLSLEEVRGTQRELMATIKGQAEVLKRIEHPVQLMMGEAIKRGANSGG